mmetsp:Transcript_127337/g.233653  ORF Transcript_127337/g.233653 Transcript_127337/m.233653 type:complete len:173 (-) Transcript_127337:38-556(-)
MQDHETLEELPLQAELTVAMVSEASLRAQAAAAVLEGFDRNTILQDRRSNGSVTLVYIWCLIALEAVYGRDPKVWRECLEFGIIPTLPRGLPLYSPYEIRKFQTTCWPNGSVFPAEPLLEALRRLDHLALERAMNTSIDLKHEFRLLPGVRNLNSTLLGSWLDVSVKPLLLK